MRDAKGNETRDFCTCDFGEGAQRVNKDRSSKQGFLLHLLALLSGERLPEPTN